MRICRDLNSGKLLLLPFGPTSRSIYNRQLVAGMDEHTKGLDVANLPDDMFEGCVWRQGFANVAPSLDDLVSLMEHAADKGGLPKLQRMIHQLPAQIVERCVVEGVTTEAVIEILDVGSRSALWWALLMDGKFDGQMIKYPRPSWEIHPDPPATIFEFLMVLQSRYLNWRDDVVPASDLEMRDFLTRLGTRAASSLGDQLYDYLCKWGHIRSLEYIFSRRNVADPGVVAKARLGPDVDWEEFPRLAALAMSGGSLPMDRCQLRRGALRELLHFHSGIANASDQSLCYRKTSILSNPELPAHLDFMIAEIKGSLTPDRHALVLAKGLLQDGLREEMVDDLPGVRTRKASGTWSPRPDRAILRLLYRPDIKPERKGTLLLLLSASSKLDYILSLRKSWNLKLDLPEWRKGEVVIDPESIMAIMRRKTALAKLGKWLSLMAVQIKAEGTKACVPALVTRRMSCSDEEKKGVDYWIAQLTRTQPQQKEGET